MTGRERAVIRAVVRALEGEQVDMWALCMSYGVEYRASQPVKNRVAALLKALIEDSKP